MFLYIILYNHPRTNFYEEKMKSIMECDIVKSTVQPGKGFSGNSHLKVKLNNLKFV